MARSGSGTKYKQRHIPVISILCEPKAMLNVRGDPLREAALIQVPGQAEFVASRVVIAHMQFNFSEWPINNASI